MKKQILIGLLALSPLLRAEEAKLDLESLDQRLKIAERKLELAAEAADTAKKGDAFLSAGPGGFILSSADKNWSLKIGGLVQLDSRDYFEDQKIPQSNTLAIRRARLQLDAGLGPLAKLRLQTDLASSTIVDAYGDLKLAPWATLRLGLFKTPLSLERWRSDPARDFVELGYSSYLVTDRDTGAWLELADADQVFSIGAGIFNGSFGTGNVVNSEVDGDDKDVVAKIFTHPFRAIDSVNLRDIGLGLAASAGNHSVTNLTSFFVPPYNVRSLGQYAYIFGISRNGAVDGANLRLVPQAYAYLGRLSFLGEYVHSADMVRYYIGSSFPPPPANVTLISNEAYQVQLGWVLTGEDASFSGLRLSQNSHSWGALQLVGRVQGVNFDRDAFNQYDAAGAVSAARLIDPHNFVSGVRSWGLGLNYVPASNIKLLLDWEESSFTDGATRSEAPFSPADRETEKVLFTRAQFTF